MALFVLNEDPVFPPVHLSEPDGLLAMGGDLLPDRLLAAYKNGIFPWYENDPILWWCPNPRFVLSPKKIVISNSVKKILQNNEFEFSVNKAFSEVIHNCRSIKRAGQQGTWITVEVEKAFITMHELGYAHSAEIWQNGILQGGLYGIKIGKVFFGESMFSKISNASRIAFTLYVQQLSKEGIKLIDCQVYTDYLKSFGAEMIPRKDFIQLLKKLAV